MRRLTLDEADEVLGGPTLTLDEIAAQRAPGDYWLIPGLVSRTSTFVYGKPKAGKSFLVSNIITGLTTGAEVLDRTPTETGLGVFVACTDHDGHREYADRARPLGADGGRVYARFIGSMPQAETWEAILAQMLARDLRVLVVDTATGALADDMNNDAPWRELHRHLDEFIRENIAVVLVGHSSDKSASGKPLGSTFATSGVRWLVNLGDRTPAGVQRLTTRGNLAHSETITVGQDHEGRFQITTELEAPPKRERAAVTKDKNQARADYVVEHCQGLNKKQTAEELASAGLVGSARSAQTMLGPTKPLVSRVVSS